MAVKETSRNTGASHAPARPSVAVIVWCLLALAAIAISLWLWHDGFRVPSRGVDPDNLPFRWSPQRVDEQHHFRQIKSFLRGNYTPDEKLAMLPGYHAAVAVLAKALRFESLATMRLVSVIAGFIVAALFYWMNWMGPSDERSDGGERDATTAALRTAQFYYLPILFPFTFLVYSDAVSLIPVLGMIAAAMRRRHLLAGALAMVSLLCRQNNIFWVSLALAITYVDAEGVKLSVASLARHANKSWLLVLAHLAFVVFVIVNRGVAINDRSSNVLGIFWNNLFLALLCVTLFFLPMHIANAPAMLALVNRRPLACMAALVVTGVIFFWPHAIHTYNADQYMLKNWVVWHMHDYPAFRVGAFVLVLLALWSLAVTKLRTPWMWVIYPFIVISLITAWVVEPRYWIIGLSLFVFARARQPAWVEYSTATIMFVLALVMFRGVETMVWFP